MLVSRRQPRRLRWRCGISDRALLIVAVALFSHQLRDATRRGLYLWPLLEGSTSPVPWAVYVCTLLLVVPAAVRLCATTAGSAPTSRSDDEEEYEKNVVYNV